MDVDVVPIPFEVVIAIWKEEGVLSEEEHTDCTIEDGVVDNWEIVVVSVLLHEGKPDEVSTEFSHEAVFMECADKVEPLASSVVLSVAEDEGLLEIGSPSVVACVAVIAEVDFTSGPQISAVCTVSVLAATGDDASFDSDVLLDAIISLLLSSTIASFANSDVGMAELSAVTD